MRSIHRSTHCLWEYACFVLLFLLTVGGVLALFHFLCGRMPHKSRPTSLSNSTITVVLDAGHGGEDGGAVGTVQGKQICEKDINLSLCLAVRDLLELSGINVVLTRSEDVLLYDRNTNYQGRKKALDLAARLSVGQSIENAFFVSIHMNAFPQTQYRGLQVYYSLNDPRSALLAQRIQERVAQDLQPDNHRGIKSAGSQIYLLEHLRCPAVLVECGFLSNPEECAALADPDYRQRLAFVLFCAIYEAVCSEQNAPSADTASKYIAALSENETQIDKNRGMALDFLSKMLYNKSIKSNAKECRYERDQNHLYLLGMRNAQSQVAGALSRLRCVEFLC